MAQANGSLPKFAKRHYEAIATAIQEAHLESRLERTITIQSPT